MKYYIGIDVSKLQLDVDWLGESKSFKNNKDGLSQLVEQLQSLLEKDQLALVLCEASGGYEQKIIHACYNNNIPIHVIHANKIRYFAKSKGIKAKTDQIDAKVITDYGVEREPQADNIKLCKNAEKIKLLLKRREQLLADKKREFNRYDKIEDKDIKEFINSHVAWLKNEIKKLEKKLHELTKECDIQETITLLTSIPGIGNLLACYIISYLPEIGKISHKAIAALVGVAPFNNDSGSHQGKRFIQGGRSVLRQMLYMAAMTSLKWNGDMKRFYERLSTAGKPGKVALVAVMRKLLSVINSVMMRRTPWQESYQQN